MEWLLIIVGAAAIFAALYHWNQYLADLTEHAAVNLEAKLPAMKWCSFEEVFQRSGCPWTGPMEFVLSVLIEQRMLDAREIGTANAPLIDPSDVEMNGLKYDVRKLEYRRRGALRQPVAYGVLVTV